MAGSKTGYQEAALLDSPLGGNSYTPPATWYVALSTAAFNPGATGATLTEVTGSGYARVAVTNNLTNFPTAAGVNPAAKTIAIDVTFPMAAADWGTVLSAYLVDASTGGNACYGADAVSPIPLPSGSSPVIQANTWNFQEI